MLTMTESAAAVIRDITSQAEVPSGAGLRIAPDVTGGLTLSVSPEPSPGDQIVDSEGARIFLDSGAAPMLDDKALDVSVDGQGGVQFTLGEQPDGGSSPNGRASRH
jgi:iron-sulfur cluster assembly protein